MSGHCYPRNGEGARILDKRAILRGGGASPKIRGFGAPLEQIPKKRCPQLNRWRGRGSVWWTHKSWMTSFDFVTCRALAGCQLDPPWQRWRMRNWKKPQKNMSRLVRKGLSSEYCEFDIFFWGLIFVPQCRW